MKKLFTSLAVVCMIVQTTRAQYAEDVLRYSQAGIYGNSKSIAMGNAVGTIGGNGVDMMFNPAGLGFYRNSNFNLTLNNNNLNTSANYLGNTTLSNRNNVQVKGINVVLAGIAQNYNGAEKSNGIVSGSFGISLNQRNDFRSNYTLIGSNAPNSFAGSMALSATDNGIPEGSYERLAWDAYLIEFDSVQNKYVAWGENGETSQREITSRSGSITDFEFSGGLNIDNKLYLGASLNISSIDYSYQAELREQNDNDTKYIYNLKQSTLNETFSQSGSAGQIKLGIIYRPIDFIRLGASFHSGKTYAMTEFGSASLYSIDSTNATFPTNQDDGTLNYEYSFKLHTPSTSTISLGFILGKYGSLSLDMERINYRNAFVRNKFDSNFEFNNSQVINTLYQAANNYRIGLEVRPVNYLSLRAGYQMIGDPYLSTALDGSKTIVSGGIGFKYQQYGVDAYYATQTLSQSRTLYGYGSYMSPVANIEAINTQVGLTFTYQF
jgi:hypothetical protein